MKLPLGNLVTIQQSSLVIVGIFGSIFFNEAFTRLKMVACCLCFVGIVIMFKPAFLFGSDEETGQASVPTLHYLVYASLPLILSFVQLVLRGLSR